MTLSSTLRRLLPALAVLSISASPSAAPAAETTDPYDGGWHFTLTPYLWLPNVNGRLNGQFPRPIAPGGADLGEFSASTEIGPNDYLEHLKLGVMATGEVRKGAWSAFTDIIYIDFGDQRSHVRDLTGPEGRSLSSVDRNATTSLSATVWTLAGAYTLVRDPRGSLDLLAGFRYVGIESDLKLSIRGSDGVLDTTRRASRDLTEWDGILGVKGQIRLGDGHWHMPYYLDVGTGSSNWTWQALLGVGYAFDWGEVNLSIRSLSYDFDDKRDADLRMTGPTLGATFRW
ncbi:hypothetical protein G3480_16725 [Thiorhodococcus mannitoliphagus]|uniref:Outer membrane protein beta-barrel domain-containing protein n=1 Tax=Thiorhodococcus mannitoliphagus TaxID=329406 RepID=A0A6P1DW63_9GAMM|nr:hypothetical protein [Thiorhodococcus mannitoliphagus]NEX21929.1 hypothetical protein [Thiorhodococcus mannitoliphagus]